MLGGMIGLPTSDWQVGYFQKNDDAAVYHSFTHFDLKLTIEMVAHEKGFKMPENDHFWVAESKIGDLGLPTLFKKVIKLMIK